MSKSKSIIDWKEMPKNRVVDKLEMLAKNSSLNLFDIIQGIEVLISRGEASDEEVLRFVRFTGWTVGSLRIAYQHYPARKDWESKSIGDMVNEAVRKENEKKPKQPPRQSNEVHHVEFDARNGDKDKSPRRKLESELQKLKKENQSLREENRQLRKTLKSFIGDAQEANKLLAV